MKDFSKAGTRQCDLSPYSNNTLISLIAPKTNSTISVDYASGKDTVIQAIIHNGKVLEKWTPIELPWTPIELPEGIRQCPDTLEYLAICGVCFHDYVVEDISIFREEYSYCHKDKYCCA